MTSIIWVGLLAISISEAPPPAVVGGSNFPPYVFMIAGNVADLWTTKAALDRGAVEANPGLAGQPFQRLALAKVAGVAAMAVLMRIMETHGHPKVARWFGYVEGAATFGVAVHNTTTR